MLVLIHTLWLTSPPTPLRRGEGRMIINPYLEGKYLSFCVLCKLSSFCIKVHLRRALFIYLYKLFLVTI
jgi:hypothetical protein